MDLADLFTKYQMKASLDWWKDERNLKTCILVKENWDPIGITFDGI